MRTIKTTAESENQLGWVKITKTDETPFPGVPKPQTWRTVRFATRKLCAQRTVAPTPHTMANIPCGTRSFDVQDSLRAKKIK